MPSVDSVAERRKVLVQRKTEVRDKLQAIRGEVEDLEHKSLTGDLTDGQVDRLARQGTKLSELEAEATRIADAERELLTEGMRSGAFTAESGHTARDLDDDPLGEPRSYDKLGVGSFKNPWDVLEDRSAMRSASINEIRSRAMSAIEKAPGMSFRDREAATKIVEDFDDKDGRLSRLTLSLSDPQYLRAFAELLKDGGRGQTILSESEVGAIRRVKAEQRAMSITDTSGGFLLPFQLDPTVIITSDGTRNDVRRIARKVVATGDVWNGVSSGAVSWSWDSEAEQVSDDATTFAQPAITIHASRGFVPFSYEVGMDAVNLTEEVGKLLAFGKDELEATAFATGSGSGEPIGIVTALQGAAPPVVASTTNDAFGQEDIYLLDEALPARYRPNASWLANRAIYNDIDGFETGNGSKRFENVYNELLGRPTYESETMTGTLATGDDYCLVYGDFESYVVADRIGMTIDFIPNLFGANQRPTGQRGLFAFYRVGADSVNDGGLKMLRV